MRQNERFAFAHGAAPEPRRQTVDIDCRGDHEVLQARFWESRIATRPQPKSADALRECPFNARPFVVLYFPYPRALLLPYNLQRLRLALGV